MVIITSKYSRITVYQEYRLLFVPESVFTYEISRVQVVMSKSFESALFILDTFLLHAIIV